ncbi:MAG: S-ribosylhomocysteine lyase [Candidatus Ornithomonoglobus sp.]
MQKIKSFQVDHRKLGEGFYISRIDGDVITYDLRFCRPNTGALVDMAAMHTIEHMLATFTRNSDIADEVVYFGPMGCQTGFYFLVRDSVSKEKALDVIKDALRKTIAYEGEVFGASEIECGNYRNLDLNAAKPYCEKYLGILENVTKVMDYDEVDSQ